MTESTAVRRKRIVLCRGQYCNLDRRADKLLKRLEVIVDELNGAAYPKPIKLEIANCLSMCGAGSNLVIYPEGVVCNGVTEQALDQIVDEHIRESLPDR